MRALLTGASSFTGLWFAEKLHAAGAEIVAPLRHRPESYKEMRALRVRRLSDIAEIVPGCSFGDDRFLGLVNEVSFDVLCHHAAEVGNYRSPDFDVVSAVTRNTNNLGGVLERMGERGLKAVVATGSVFEQDEGGGDRPLRAFSPYGLSKGLTWQVIRYWCMSIGLPAFKFVIANPFGPFEEPRFCAYLIKTWRLGGTAEVRTPLYVRDNIHVDLLALTYARFVHAVVQGDAVPHFGPCGYIETQGEFTERVAAALRPRLGYDCRIKMIDQKDFPEPRMRINSDAIEPASYGWEEAAAWDALAEFYGSVGL